MFEFQVRIKGTPNFCVTMTMSLLFFTYVYKAIKHLFLFVTEVFQIADCVAFNHSSILHHVLLQNLSCDCCIFEYSVCLNTLIFIWYRVNKIDCNRFFFLFSGCLDLLLILVFISVFLTKSISRKRWLEDIFLQLKVQSYW